MNVLKLTILIFLISLVGVPLYGQSVKDYFVPDAPNNKATFYFPNKTGGKTNAKRIIYYLESGNSYKITDAKFTGNQTAIQTSTVLFTSDGVRMTESVISNPLKTNDRKTYAPPRIILKMPPKNGEKTWNYIDATGTYLECTSSWTDVIVNDSSRQAIKIEKIIVELSFKNIEYYVKNIGLWKAEMQPSGMETFTSSKFIELSYDPNAK